MRGKPAIFVFPPTEHYILYIIYSHFSARYNERDSTRFGVTHCPVIPYNNNTYTCNIAVYFRVVLMGFLC